MSTKNIILVLGDQLTPTLSSLTAGSPASDVVLMVESQAAASVVPYHKKKLALVFAAMRHFADDLTQAGWTVDYVPLDAPDHSGSITSETARAVKRHRADAVLVTEPSRWQARQALDTLADRLSCPLHILDDDRFLSSHREFADWAEGRKQLRMENFYRDMRRKTGLLMDGDKPVGGKWNFDAENRKPAKGDLFMPAPKRFKPDAVTSDVLALVEDRFPNNFGDLHPFWFGVTAKQAQAAFTKFVKEALPLFGDFQDAMLTDEKYLYHSITAQYLNLGLLHPLEICRQVEIAYRDGHVPLNAAEGFIRQIIGWREYVRGIYWLHMPAYADTNYLEAQKPLPDFYWTGETDLACLRAAITQTKEDAYAHHIQRLMVTGNFAMLLGVAPKEIHKWYLAVYADAYEWVELPNTIGMSQFADGGILGSKPYAASGNYINKMSDYCSSCAYDVKKKTGPEACPFNALYWDFLVRNEKKLAKNPRISRVYRTWNKMSLSKRKEYRDSAASFMARIAKSD